MTIYQHELKNAYVGEYTHFTPTSNTVAYYPFNIDFKDYSGNSHDLTGVNSPSILYKYGVSCLYLPNNPASGSTNSYLTATINTLPQGGANRTEMCWILWEVTGAGIAWYYGTNSNYKADLMTWKTSPISWGSYGYNCDSNINATTLQWYHIAMVASTGSQKIYVNGVQAGTSSHNINTTGTNLKVGADYANSSRAECISELIFENRIWSATEIQNYYNLTKANYGL